MADDDLVHPFAARDEAHDAAARAVRGDPALAIVRPAETPPTSFAPSSAPLDRATAVCPARAGDVHDLEGLRTVGAALAAR